MRFLRHPATILFIFSTIYAEILSGATPLFAYLNPTVAIFQFAFYGSAAVLIREISQRSRSKWTAVAILGIALAILEEGFMTKVFFNPASGVSPLVEYGASFGVNWVLSLQLILYHSLVSVAVPIGLTELIFKSRSEQTWLGRRGFVIMLAILVISTLVGTALVFTYVAPTILMILSLVSVVLLVAYARTAHITTSSPKNRSSRTLFVAGLSYLTAILSAAFILPLFGVSPVLIAVYLILIGILAIHLVRKTIWEINEQFAVIAGVTASLVAFDLLMVVMGQIEMAFVAGVVVWLFFRLRTRLNLSTQPNPV